MTIDTTTRQAIAHTYHCLIGCGIGEVIGMVIASTLGWDKIGRVTLAIVLAFLFGYALTYLSVRKHISSPKRAMKITLTTDTVSITTMEVVANTMEFIIPGALSVSVVSLLFWWGLVVSFAVAFIVTVPVNRYMIRRGAHAHHH